MPTLPSWPTEPLWDQFAALLPPRPVHDPAHPPGGVPPAPARRKRTHARRNAFHRLARCHERRIDIIDAFLDVAETAITVRSRIRRAWTTHRRDDRPTRRP